MTKQNQTNKLLKNFVNGSQILSKFEQTKSQQFLIEGVLPETSSLTCLYGKHGSYKSFVVLDMSLCLSHGTDYHGHKVKQQNVLYVSGEGSGGLWKRIIAWHKHNGIDDISDNFSVYETSINLRSDIERSEFIQAIQTLKNKPDIIVFDTLSRCFGDAEENSNSDMSAFVRSCDCINEQVNSKIIIVHHSGKDASKGARGGSALAAAVDTEILIKSEKDNFCKLQITKQKNHEQSEPLRFKALEIPLGEAEGVLLKSLALKIFNNFNKDKNLPLTGNRGAVLNALKLAIEEGGGDKQAVSYQAWKLKYFDFNKSNSNRSLFSQYHKVLKEAGMVEEIEPDLFTVTC